MDEERNQGGKPMGQGFQGDPSHLLAFDQPHIAEGRALDLLYGLLSPDQASATLAHLKRCAECEAIFRRSAGERERLRARGLPEPADIQPRRRVWIAAGTGAFAAAAAVAVLFLRAGDTSDLPAYWIPADRELLTLRSDAGGDDAIHEGVRAYAARDAERAIELLGGTQVSGGLEDARRIYLASALTRAGRHRQALATLAGLDLATMPVPWRGDALWIQAEALLATGQRERADSLHTLLQREPGSAGDLARSLPLRRPS
jgi:hypothetical protein